MIRSLTMAISLRVTAGLLGGMAALFALLAVGAAYSQENEDGPRVTSQSLEDGAVLAEVPYVIQLCFSEPIDIEASGEDRGFSLEIRTPEGGALGKRISRQRDGLGFEVFPGGVPGLPAGSTPAADQTWTFEWSVTAQDDGAPAEGTITFTLDDDGEVVPEEALPACRASAPTASGTDADGDPAGDEDDGTDVLYIVLLAAGAIGGLVAVSLVGYVIRKRGEGGRDGPASRGTQSG